MDIREQKLWDIAAADGHSCFWIGPRFFADSHSRSDRELNFRPDHFKYDNFANFNWEHLHDFIFNQYKQFHFFHDNFEFQSKHDYEFHFFHDNFEFQSKHDYEFHFIDDHYEFQSNHFNHHILTKQIDHSQSNVRKSRRCSFSSRHGILAK